MRTTLGRDSRFPMARRNEEDEEMKRTHRDTLHTYYARAGVRARGGVFARAVGCSRARWGVRARAGVFARARVVLCVVVLAIAVRGVVVQGECKQGRETRFRPPLRP